MSLSRLLSAQALDPARYNLTMTKTIKNVLTGSKVSIKVDGREVAIAEGVTYTMPTYKTPIIQWPTGVTNPLPIPVENFLDILKRTGNAEAGHLLDERGLSFPGIKLKSKGIISISSPVDEDQLKQLRKEWGNAIAPRKGPRGCK